MVLGLVMGGSERKKTQVLLSRVLQGRWGEDWPGSRVLQDSVGCDRFVHG